MDYTLAFALSLLQLSVCTPVPVTQEVANVVKMKTKVKWMAEQLVVRLDRDFQVTRHGFYELHSSLISYLFLAHQRLLSFLRQVPIGMTLDPPADELGGSALVVASLEGYNSLISDSFGGVLQIKAEISSLTGYLDHWRQSNCKEQRPKPALPGPLQELQRRKGFIHSVTLEALMRVKEFLNLLLKNLDHLERC